VVTLNVQGVAVSPPYGYPVDEAKSLFVS